jgi:hypothetical protein
VRKFAIALSFVAWFISAGCHAAQNPVTPPQSTCQPAGSYTALNGLGTTSTTYTATKVTVQTCFLAQGYLPAANGVSAQTGGYSNIVGPSIGGATGDVNLAVTCTAGSGTTCTGVQWEFFSAPAVTALAPATPSVGSPTESKVVKPALPSPTPGNTIGAVQLAAR